MKIYSAQYDIWLLAVLTALLFVGLVAGFELVQSNLLAGVLLFAIIVAITFVFLILGVPCEYYLDDDHLRIRSGLQFRSISYADIKAAEQAQTVLPQPAWSLKRVDIVLASGIFQISPAKREDFLSDINSRLAAFNTEHGGL
jgi:uncharacterized membrane protein YdbT with pleckstrin-like domain